MAERPRIVFWFSCGTASAVNTRLGIARYKATHDIAVARCVVPEEDDDNDRFAGDIERWLDWPIINLRSAEYESCEDVWRRERYMSGVHGARCTTEMKKAVRWEFERTWHPDLQGFGYTVDERHRANRFREQNPEITLVTLLIDEGLRKEDCHAIIDRAGIVLPWSYRVGFDNANCIGCVNAQSPTYWNLVRRVRPDVFTARAVLSRKLGVRLVKLTTGDRERIYLDELVPEMGRGERMPHMDCSLLCYIAEMGLNDAH